MTTRDLDIVVGQTIAMHGYDCIVREVEASGIVVEYPNGEIKWEDVEEVAEQNEDLILEEEW